MLAQSFENAVKKNFSAPGNPAADSGNGPSDTVSLFAQSARFTACDIRNTVH